MADVQVSLKVIEMVVGNFAFARGIGDSIPPSIRLSKQLIICKSTVCFTPAVFGYIRTI